jgi:pyridoxamine 5'-phosphate oxidase
MTTTQPAWANSLEALLEQHAHLPFSKFVQAATVRQDGRPANRTLTFRFFLNDSRLLFTTDIRTEKATQLDANPWVELCWYFVESRVQVRLLGTMRLLEGLEDEELVLARDRTWRERTEESRQSFTWPAAGLLLSAPPAFSESAPALPPATFGVLLFTSERVEILDISCQPHAREVHAFEFGAWSSTRINP